MTIPIKHPHASFEIGIPDAMVFVSRDDIIRCNPTRQNPWMLWAKEAEGKQGNDKCEYYVSHWDFLIKRSDLAAKSSHMASSNRVETRNILSAVRACRSVIAYQDFINAVFSFVKKSRNSCSISCLLCPVSRTVKLLIQVFFLLFQGELWHLLVAM